MASNFLSDNERVTLSGQMDMVFNTLSQGRTITVIKEPARTMIANPVSSNIFGFGEHQENPIYTYSPISGVFSAIINYGATHTSPLNPEINVRIYSGPVTMKVKRDCKDYIFCDRNTKHILIDDKAFYIDGEPIRQMLLNSEYFIIPLKATK